MQKKVLGKGLSAILSDLPPPAATVKPAPALAREDTVEADPASAAVESLAPSEEGSYRVLEVPLDRIDPNPRQPRHHFDSAKLAELSSSIEQEGVLQPILLVRRGERFEVVAGERRLRAARAAGLERVPAMLTEVSEKESLKLALVENLQRDDLDPIEEAHAFRIMIEDFAWTQDELGAYLNRDRSTISNTLRLLQLPEEVQAMLARGSLSAGHVRTLIGLEREICLQLARHIERRQLSVRQAERLAKTRKRPSGRRENRAAEEDPLLRSLRERMESRFGLPVKLQYRGGRGKLEVMFGSDRELERIMQVLEVSLDGQL